VVGQLLLSRSATFTFMNFSDPAVLATFWSLAFVISEIIGMSKLKENSVVQLLLKLFRVLYGSFAKKVTK
jgi:hypothetical protein